MSEYLNKVTVITDFVAAQWEKANSSDRGRQWTLAAGAGIGVLAGLLLSGVFSSKNRAVTSDAWQLTVTLRFKTLADKEAFLPFFEPLAAFVQRQEKATLSYIISESDKDPKQLFILERYTSKDTYLSVHKTSPEFLHFREKLLQMQNKGRVAIDGQSYKEMQIGFIN